MQQFGASAFYAVVRWRKLCDVDNEYILHNSIVLAILCVRNYQIWWIFDKVLTKTKWNIFWYIL